MSKSFIRTMSVKVFATNSKFLNNETLINYDDGYTEFRSIQPDGSQGFRIKAKITLVESTIGLAVNPISVTLYNLGQDSRSLIESKLGTKISIEAGYDNKLVSLATGNILWSRTHKEGPDYITEVIAGDSSFGQANASINTSFKGKVEYVQLIEACIQELQNLGINAGTIIAPSGGFNNGFVLIGSPMDNLSRIASKTNSRAFIVNGEINFIPLAQSLGTPIEISTETGMIGIPEVGSPGVIGAVPDTVQVSPQKSLSFTTLLRADLTLGALVRIKSKFVNGDFNVLRVVHDVDSWSGPFFTHCEASIPTGNP